MARRRFSEDQILGILDMAKAVGNVRAVCREHSISEQTVYRWRKKYPDYESDARRLRNFESENKELKKILAEITQENRQLRSKAKELKLNSLIDHEDQVHNQPAIAGIERLGGGHHR